MNAVARFFDNRMNPLLLRELRQLVRNRYIIVLINLFIAVLVTACMMTVLFREGTHRDGIGSVLFNGLTFILGLACFLAVVVYTAMTTANERLNGDLMFTSALRPSSIVLGKSLAGGVLTILLMSITAPFVTLAYLLRGLDIEVVVVTFLHVFVAIQVFNGLAICLFANVKSKVQISVLVAVGFFPAAYFVLSALFVPFAFSITRHSLWEGLAWSVLVEGAILLLCLSGAVASIAPPTSNRLLPFRVIVTAIYVVSLLIGVFGSSFLTIPDPRSAWVYGWTVALIVLMPAVVSERDSWSPRVKQTVPRSLVFRALCFPFFTGSPNGLFWLGLLLIPLIGGVYLFDPSFSGNDLQLVLHLLLFAFDYCITALLIRCRLLSRSIPANKTWTIAVVLFLTLTFGSMLAFFLTNTDSAARNDFWEAYCRSGYSILNPFLLGDWSQGGQARITAAGLWGAVLVPPLLLWFCRRVVHFSPNDTGNTLTLEQAVAAVRDTAAANTARGSS